MKLEIIQKAASLNSFPFTTTIFQVVINLFVVGQLQFKVLMLDMISPRFHFLHHLKEFKSQQFAFIWATGLSGLIFSSSQTIFV